MHATSRSGPDIATVDAARAVIAALDALVAQSLPLVYNIVGRALAGHADVDDVVQETLLRVVRDLAELRDPAAYRSWLVAIAVRQVRDRQQRRGKPSLTRHAHLDDAGDVPDPAADFADLTIVRLGLTDQRREVAEATRWLAPTTGSCCRCGGWRRPATRPRRAGRRAGLSAAARRGPGRADEGAARDGPRGRTGAATPARLRRLDRDRARLGRHPEPAVAQALRPARPRLRASARPDARLLPMDRLLAGLPLLAVPRGSGARARLASCGEPAARRPRVRHSRARSQASHPHDAAARCPRWRPAWLGGGRGRRRGCRRPPGARTSHRSAATPARARPSASPACRRRQSPSATPLAEPVADSRRRRPEPVAPTAVEAPAKPAVVDSQGRQRVDLHRRRQGARAVRRQLVLHVVDQPQRRQRAEGRRASSR